MSTALFPFGYIFFGYSTLLYLVSGFIFGRILTQVTENNSIDDSQSKTNILWPKRSFLTKEIFKNKNRVGEWKKSFLAFLRKFCINPRRSHSNSIIFHCTQVIKCIYMLGYIIFSILAFHISCTHSILWILQAI